MLNFNETVLRLALSDLDNGKQEVLIERISTILDSMNGEHPFLFNASPELFNQFCHSCCHALAEHLLYSLHAQQGFEVAHVQFIHGVSIHSCIEITRNNNVYYLDAGGVFMSLEQVMERYISPTLDFKSLEIVRRCSDTIIEDGDNEEIRKLTELTPFWEVISVIGDNEGIDRIGDFEENSLNNIALGIII